MDPVWSSPSWANGVVMGEMTPKGTLREMLEEDRGFV
jgi:hypothetical protein